MVNSTPEIINPFVCSAKCLIPARFPYTNMAKIIVNAMTVARIDIATDPPRKSRESIQDDPGKLENKPDVIKQLMTIKEGRRKMIEEHIKQQNEYQNKMNTLIHPQIMQQQLNEQTIIIQQLIHENIKLKEQVQYLDNKIKQLINIQIQKKKEEKRIELLAGNY